MKKLVMAVVAAVAAICVGHNACAALPSEYQEVEYLESTGQQYINEFYPCDAKTRIEFDFTLLESGSPSFFGGAFGGYEWLFIIQSSVFCVHSNGKSLGTPVVGKRYFGVFEQTQATLANLTDGTDPVIADCSSATMGPASGTKNIRLFGDTSNIGRCKIKLHSIRIYEDGELVRNGVPCYLIDGKVPGLYDTVNDHFYTNDRAEATEDFKLGEETGNAIIVKGEPSEVGEPVCGSLVGYGSRLVAGGEQVVAQVDETEVSGDTADWSLLGWRLDVTDANGTVTTTSTAENFNRCAFTHEDGKKDFITWYWKKTPKLPADYVAVEYIESTGAQTINAIYTAGKDTKVEIDFMPQLTSSETAIFGSSWGGGSWLFLTRSGTFQVYAGGTSFGSGSAQAGSHYQAVLEYDHGVVSNLTAGTVFSASGYAMGSGNTLKLFGMGGSYMARYRLYGLKIYEKVDGEEVLKRDFVPCYTTIDDQKVAGLYDVENSKFYPNSLTGADFITGPATANFLSVVGEPGEYGTPFGEVSGYGISKLADGQVATVSMNETVVEQDTLTATLKGWMLVQKNRTTGVVTETHSTDENLTTCTFTHRGGDQDILTWIWDVTYKVGVPEGYQQVEYIQGTGSQYISGVYKCEKDTRIEMDFRLDSTATAGIFGGGWGNAWLLQINGNFTMCGPGSGIYVGTGVAGDTYHSVHTSTWSVMTNLTKGTSSRGEYGTLVDATIALWGVSSYRAKYALYGMSIYEQGDYADELKRLLVPCYANDNGTKVAGLYDVVNAKFYKNAAAGDDFVLGEPTDNYLDVVGDPGEAGEPHSGDGRIGYGRYMLASDEEVTCTMPETTIETPELGATLLGWKLEIWRGETLVSSATNTAENVDTCTFTHVRGNSARLTWFWKSKYCVTVVATGGLDVSPSYMWVNGGEDVSFTATGGEAVWDGPGLDPKTHRSPTCKLTNITGPTTVTVCTPNVVYVATNGVDEAGRGTADAPYKTIKYAIDNTAAPLDVMVGAGTHSYVPAELPLLADDIRVIGESRTNTIVYASKYQAGKAVFTLKDTFAVVMNVTVKILSAAYMGSDVGAAFDITSGTVTNVLCTACGSAGGTGVVNLRGDGAYFGDSVIDNCMLWNGACCMLSVSAGLAERIRITRTYTGYSDNSGCGVRLTGKNAVVRNCLLDGANLTYVITKGCPAAYVSKGLLENCTIVNNFVKSSSNTGLYVASADAQVRNCIITGNTGAESDAINVAFANDDCRAALSYSCCPELPNGVNNNLSVDPQFTDAANGDYTLQETSLCINMGCDTEAELDFAGNPRKYNGSRPDMGCYEFQGEPVVKMYVVFSPTVDLGMEELDTTFNAMLFGSTGASVDYAWDFGDGSSVTHTSVPTVDHHYGAPGEYTVVLACDDGVDTCASTSTCIRVNTTTPVRYVNASNPNPKFPYATPETACRDFDAVWTQTPAPEEIHVAPGTYYVTPTKRVYTLDRAMKVVGDDPDTVIFFASEQQTGKAIFTLNHEDALLTGVRLGVTGNGYCSGTPSGLDIVCGTASNVLVRGCGAHNAGAVRLRGPKALFVDSRVTHCESWSGSQAVLYITEGLADRITMTNNVEHYSNIFETALRLDGANAICRNSFFARNASGGAGWESIKPAVRVVKGVLENCTVVTNNGGTSTCGGIYVAASADAIVRNCISADNVASGCETTKNFQLADGASVSHCCSPDLEDGVNGNKSGNPQFKTVRGTGFAYGIRSTSPCFNAGEKLPWMDGALDYLRQPRVNAAPDIGCVESQSKGLMLMVK